jgi:hypothetical protein
MKNKIKIIDLLCLISNGEEVPKKIKYGDVIYKLADVGEDYYNYDNNFWFFRDRFDASILNDYIEILDEENKDIPLIPDDELWIINKRKGIIDDCKYGIDGDTALNYNFKVLKEKINQVVKELNKRQ